MVSPKVIRSQRQWNISRRIQTKLAFHMLTLLLQYALQGGTPFERGKKKNKPKILTDFEFPTWYQADQ